MEVIDKKFVSLNNMMTRLRKKKCPPEGLLLLFPHCIQNSNCKQNIKHEINECIRCGKCKVKDLLELSEEYGISIAVASGGRIALKRVMAKEVQGVVAIACEKGTTNRFNGRHAKSNIRSPKSKALWLLCRYGRIYG